MQPVGILAARALVDFCRVCSRGRDKAYHLAIPVKAAYAEGILAAVKIIRAFVEHKPFRDKVLKIFNFPLEFEVFVAQAVMRKLHINKVSLEVGYFLDEFLVVNLFGKLVQGCHFGNYIVDYIYHALKYSATEGESKWVY
jgi:hypothetical protein